MGFLKDFKRFATKGNLVDTAIAFLMGTAFGKVVSSFIDGLIAPILGILTGGSSLKDWAWTYKEEVKEGDKVVEPALEFKYGEFISEIISFLLVALVCYIVIKKLLKKDPNAAPDPTPTESLLGEIRDLLKK